MMAQYITGIQQAGIGVADAVQAKYLYRDLFGMNALIFEDKAPATLMTRYTGKKEHWRHAMLSLNMSGGGGFEIWQFISRTPQKAAHPPLPGDPGIFALKIKSRNVRAAHAFFSTNTNVTVTPVMRAPDERPRFWLTDLLGNHFEIVEGDEWFKKDKSICGGVAGAVIGVTNMEKSIHFYKDLLGIHEVTYKVTGPMTDTPYGQPPGQVFSRVLLKKELSAKGAFSKFLGAVQIELVEAKDSTPRRIFENRYWGDCGFIHLCFDVLQMDLLKTRFGSSGYPFSVDSQDSFSMGSAAGRFCYVEDPDGTLIELVETHKVPVLKRFGWYVDLQKRDAGKPLPNWMIGMLGLNKIR
jgi:catechol 2,3-dioxygenase-like lactoylglutathione lyase family enzyme